MTRVVEHSLARSLTPAARRPSRRPTTRLHVRDLEDRLAPATLTVTNTNDSGVGSLRQAVADANLAGDDVIVFDTSGVFANPQTISLLKPLPTIESAGGALTITGTGAANLTVRRDPAATTDFRLFETLAPAFTLTGATLTGGNPAADGGAIRAGTSGNVITLDGVRSPRQPGPRQHQLARRRYLPDGHELPEHPQQRGVREHRRRGRRRDLLLQRRVPADGEHHRLGQHVRRWVGRRGRAVLVRDGQRQPAGGVHPVHDHHPEQHIRG